MQEPINNQSMLQVGTVLRGIYRIDSYLSSGGFGNTYVATNIEFEERVAIKEFFMKGVTQRDNNQTTVSVSNTENHNSFLEQREKFKKEARRLRQLNNPHIVRVHDLFEENGTAYYVMDHVDGENLSDRLKRTGKPMTEAEVNEILPQVLDALKTVHDAGIWHLDLKPANIMVDKSGNVKLIDFGASKQLNAQKGGATSTGNQKTGDPTVGYKLDVSSLHTAANVDLLWGLRGDATYSETDGTDNTGTVGNSYNTDLTKQTVSEKVAFLFKHALAKIGGKNGLKIVADIDGNGAGLSGFGSLDSKTCITVRSITIKNVGSEDFKESGTFDLATGSWFNLTNASTQPSAEALISETIQDGTSSTIKMNEEIYNATGTPTYSSGWSPLGVTTTAKDVYATDGQDAFYLIPGSSVTLQVAINYDITTYDENINDNYVKINQTITNNVTVAVPATATNKYYTLVLHLGLTSVKFSAEVADWEDASSDPTTAEEIWLPSNVVNESTSVSLASGSGATVNTAAGTTSYTITVTGLASGKDWTAAVASEDATISTTSGTTSSTSQDVTVTLTANDSTTATKENVITFTCDGTTTTITIIQAKATS